MAERFTAEQLNEAADTYGRCLKLIQAGDDSPRTKRVLDEAGMEVLNMVEPFLLTYYRFLTGQRTALSPELRQFLRLFRRKGDTVDNDTLIYRITSGVRRACLDCAEHDCSTGEEEGVGPYIGSELYSWFTSILFGSILPVYKVRYTDHGIRINFFRAFQVLFRHEIARKVKDQVGWDGRWLSIEECTEAGMSFPADGQQEDLRHELGLNPVEWRLFKGLRSRDLRRRRRARAQSLVEATLLGKLSAYRTAVLGTC